MAWLCLLLAREDFNTRKVEMHFWKTWSVSEKGFMELSSLRLCWSWDRTEQDISALNNPCQPRTAGVLFQAKPSGRLRAPAHVGWVPWGVRVWGVSPCPHMDAKQKMTV